MSKYFAKYLPVEGEIKEGDQFIDEYNHIYRCTKVTNGGTYGSGYSRSINLRLSKKVKLFLCSRDIQVGDEFITTDALTKPLDTKSICTGINNDLEILDKDCEDRGWNILRVGKVIGEISPDATWVKEGDEFEEDGWGLRMRAGLKSGSIEVDKKHLNRFREKGIVSYCSIKGPCGHFH